LLRPFTFGHFAVLGVGITAFGIMDAPQKEHRLLIQKFVLILGTIR